MKVGLYFGSFNPVHTGHLIIANTILNNTDLQKIWFVVSPQNPLKKKSELLAVENRIHIVNIAIANNKNFELSDVEMHLPFPSYTVNTLQHLKAKYPEKDFFILLGSDSFLSISKWKNYKQLLADNVFIIYERPGFLVKKYILEKNCKLLKAPQLEISSTAIRQLIKNGKSIKYLVPEVVEEEILFKSYYK